jgi:hypothetical protein
MEFTANKQGEREREIGMDTRNEMCKGTEKGDK